VKILVVSTVYPNSKNPNFGIFVHERMRRVAELCQLQVMAPVPHFPFLGRIKSGYRNSLSRLEWLDGIQIHHPNFYFIPGAAKFLDGWFLYLSSLRPVQLIRRSFPFELIDAHFAYPDGFAAALLARRFSVPVTITLRGTINRLIHYTGRRQAIRWALSRAERVFSVSQYLVDLACTLGLPQEKFVVVPNGVDWATFRPEDREMVRKELEIAKNRKVLISVGALAERKGHHRVLEVLPELLRHFPDLLYIVVGGPSVEGNMGPSMQATVQELGLHDHVWFVGEVPHDEVPRFLSAADVFVLPTRYEGWANVFLEAMACGLPVVTTDVCGNAEVVRDGTGLLVPFADGPAIKDALVEALGRSWNRTRIMDYARSYTWEKAAGRVHEEFQRLLNVHP